MKIDSFVTIQLIEPVERYWGRLLALTEAGITIRGIEINQIQTFKYQFRKGETQVFPQTVFFPLRRVQRINLDESLEEVPSVIEDIKEFTGLDENRILGDS